MKNICMQACLAGMVASFGLGQPVRAQAVTVSGEQVVWHKVVLELEGPRASEEGEVNPFTDFRVDVAFRHEESGRSLVVPGYYAADGDAANSGAVEGNRWKCVFRPDEAGTWTYEVSFREGENVAMGGLDEGEALVPFDGVTGRVKVAGENPAVAPDLKAKGRLRYVGKNHLQFAGSGEYYLKFGPDSPENFLEYEEFDNTPEKGNKGIRHSFAAHESHYGGEGDLWGGGRGKAILGAIDYLAEQRANSLSMLLFNEGGDGGRVSPYTEMGERFRFDCSKLEQWELVMDHAESKGLHLHFKLAEIENCRDHDGGELGPERKLFYREMIARFGHHLALNWNLSEEIAVGAEERASWLAFFEENDPWQSPRVFHTGPSYDKGNFYRPHLGVTAMTGVSLQTPEATGTENVFEETLRWVKESSASGQPWVVACDEQGPGNLGVNASFELSRKDVLWGNLMAGGGGVEYYSGGSDLKLDDYSHFEELLEWSAIAVCDFFQAQGIPFWKMSNADELVSGEGSHCLTDGEEIFVVQLRDGGEASLFLGDVEGVFEVLWFDPRNGGELQKGSVTVLEGGGNRKLGLPPAEVEEDWVVLLRKGKASLAKEGGKKAKMVFGIEDFERMPAVDGRTEYHIDKWRPTFSINAGNKATHGKWARAEVTFEGEPGVYDVTLTTITEYDGDSPYRLLVDGKVVAGFRNPRVKEKRDMKPFQYVWKRIILWPGNSLAVESMVDSNGVISEGDGFAFARGRWKELELERRE